MRKAPLGQLFALAVFALPTTAFAAAPAEEAPAEEEDELVLEDEDEMTEAAAPATPADGGGDFGTDFLDDPADGGAAAGGSASAGSGATPPAADVDQDALDEKLIIISQRQAFLNVYRKDGRADGKKIRRFEIQPQVGFSLNDPFVRHISAGAEMQYWLTNRMALGLSGAAFFGSKTPNYERIRFQEGVLLTANRYLWEASLNFTYEPFYGKIAVFNRVLMHWEAYVQLGGGVIQSQIIPRFESIHDPFNNILGQGNFAMGGRMYIPDVKFMSIDMGVKTWVFLDKYEPSNRGPNTTVGTNMESVDNPELDDADAAKAAAQNSWAFNSMFFVGVSFYIPPTFEYSTRR
jgi:outer membrane beta-barrel protein